MMPQKSKEESKAERSERGTRMKERNKIIFASKEKFSSKKSEEKSDWKETLTRFKTQEHIKHMESMTRKT